MPKYSKSNINFIIDKDTFSRLFRNASSRRDRAWITVLWLTAARPEEALGLQKKNITINPEHTLFHIETKKLGFQKKGNFIVEKRKLRIKIKANNKYIKNLNKYMKPFKPEQHIFQFSKRTGNNIIKRIGLEALSKHLCPYNFRHSRMTILAEQGNSKEYLKRFKGARSDQSVSPYLHARKVEYDVDAEV